MIKQPYFVYICEKHIIHPNIFINNFIFVNEKKFTIDLNIFIIIPKTKLKFIYGTISAIFL